MEINYLCKECCDALGFNYYREATNEVGRKYCCGCGDNSTDLKIEKDHEIDSAVKAYLSKRGK